MNPTMIAADVMTRDVVTVTASTALEAAIRLMLDKRVSGLPVMQANALIGILTEGDLLRRVELGTDTHRTGWLEFILGPSRLAKNYVETHSRTVGDIMTAPARFVDVATPLAEVVGLMESKHIKRVPVLAGGTLVGVVSRSDLLRSLANSLAQDPAQSSSDATIHAAVLAELARQSWAPRGGISIVVADGVVNLEGTIFEEPERAAIRVAAENVPGVRSVRDHLVWVEPNSGMTFSPG